MKQAYPYDLKKDSILIEVVLNTLKNEEEVFKAIQSHLKENEIEYFHSAKIRKETFFQVNPPKVRTWITNNEQSRIVNLFQELLKENPTPIDITLEFLEWLFIGFDEKKLFTELISILFNQKISLPDNFFEECRNNYEEIMQGNILPKEKK
ncbi:MAG: hypothetical protein SFU98_21230 [Leptospiraceae bacterium]|nr:hypothetical protein [Leptospiraceae bacterium]